MTYMLLLYSEQDGSPSFSSPEEAAAYMQPWMDYTQALKDSGVYLGGDALKPTSTATSVRLRDGERIVTDGPFAETTETLGGYYMIDVPDLDAALHWAEKCPLSAYGTVEVRPLHTFD